MKEGKWRQLLARIGIGALFLFAIVSNVRLIIRNYHIQERIDVAKREVERLETRNQKLNLLLSYYASPSYQEVEARRRLGLKKPDETAYIVKGIILPDNAGNELESTIYKEAAEPEPATAESNVGRWWQYLRGE